jgi:hypothetical protein
VAASEVGTAHQAIDAECQDSCFTNVETDPAKSPLLAIFVADGAGSAANGGLGAELAMEAASAFVSKLYALSEFSLNKQWAKECLQAVREKIYETAERNKAKARDYACTFLGVVASSSETLLTQIGDGGIVVDVGDGLVAPIAPMTGEYANMTNFVTDDNAIDILQVKVFSSLAHKVAVFSDGIQRLALNMATNEVHAPFFNPFFDILAKATEEQEDFLQCELARFLQSQAVNERTDDDKTLAFAHWIERSL